MNPSSMAGGAGPGLRANVRTTLHLASASMSVPLAAVHSTGPGTAGRPLQILVSREGAVPQPRAHQSDLVRLAYNRLSVVFL